METLLKQDKLPYIYDDTFNSTRKKILFACVPADGHFNPLVPLAVSLKELGHDVRWYTSVFYAEKINRLNIQHHPLKKALDLDGKAPEVLFPERARVKSQVKKLFFDITHGFILRVPEYFKDIQEIRNDFSFNMMIVDNLFFAIPFIKNILKVPVLSVGVVPLMESSKDIAPHGLGLLPPQNCLQAIKYKVLGYITSFLFKKPTKLLRDFLNSMALKCIRITCLITWYANHPYCCKWAHRVLNILQIQPALKVLSH